MAELAVGEALSLLRDPALDHNIRLAHVSRILAYAGKPAVAGTLEELRRRGRKADFASVFALLGTGEADALDGLRSALPLFEASDRQGIQTFLSYFDRKSAASVANLLSNGSAAIRIIACSVLGNLRHRESVDNLYRLAASDSNESVRTEALFALGKMTDNKEAHQSLELLLNRDDVGVRMGAILLLSKAGIPVLGKLHAPA
jgi:HEAT repeat protein